MTAAHVGASGVDVPFEAAEVVHGTRQLEHDRRARAREAEVHHGDGPLAPVAPVFPQEVREDLRRRAGSQGPQHRADRVTLAKGGDRQIRDARHRPTEVEEHGGEGTREGVLAAAGHAAQRAGVLEAVHRVDVLASRHRAAAGEGDPHVRPRQRDEIQACRMSVLVRAHRDHRILADKAQVVDLTCAGVLAARLVGEHAVGSRGAAVQVEPHSALRVHAAPAIESHLGVVAAEADQAGPHVAAVDCRVGHLEALAQLAHVQVHDLHSRLPTPSPARGLRHCDDLVFGDSQVHGQARRVVQLDVLDIELRRPARPPPPWEPAVPVNVEVLGFPVGVEIRSAAPARPAEEPPDLAESAHGSQPDICREQSDDVAGLQELQDQHAEVL
mmetsp:Transcript_36477/g.108406  ORF Transcript_36477/g.108406 Transcript_36477/m.108406 type:complete len:385 (+) Transcript_36477:144-1298(+)